MFEVPRGRAASSQLEREPKKEANGCQNGNEGQDEKDSRISD